MLSLENSLKEYSKFTDFINNYISGKRCKDLLEFFGERELTLSSSPYSVRDEGVGSYPGGYIVTINKLIETSLVMDKVWERFGYKKSYTIDELVFSALTCEIGKLGTNDEPFFLKNDNSWEVEKRGLLYKYNPKYTNFKYSDGSIFLLQSSGITLSENEFMAIKLYGSVCDEENSHYYRFENQPKSNLFRILNQAREIVLNIK